MIIRFMNTIYSSLTWGKSNLTKEEEDISRIWAQQY